MATTEETPTKSDGGGEAEAVLWFALEPAEVTERLKVDPAVSSAVFVTTITDVTGFFSFLGLAALVGLGR